MGWIPGWDLIASAGWWSGFFFWASIVSLIGLGISEIASHRYSERKDELVTQQQLTEKKQHDDQIARLHLETANADARAADANQKAEAERLERIKLEAAVAPRSLSLDKQKAIAEAWKPFAGRKVRVVSYAMDGEAAILGQQIVACLQEAGLTVDDARASFMPLGGFAFGVHVNGTDGSFVVAIVNALLSAGITDMVWDGTKDVGSSGDPPIPNAAEILVAVKMVKTIR